jgi:hypothetical protein
VDEEEEDDDDLQDEAEVYDADKLAERSGKFEVLARILPLWKEQASAVKCSFHYIDGILLEWLICFMKVHCCAIIVHLVASIAGVICLVNDCIMQVHVIAQFLTNLHLLHLPGTPGSDFLPVDKNAKHHPGRCSKMFISLY